jgi:hypothetical protein
LRERIRELCHKQQQLEMYWSPPPEALAEQVKIDAELEGILKTLGALRQFRETELRQLEQEFHDLNTPYARGWKDALERIHFLLDRKLAEWDAQPRQPL